MRKFFLLIFILAQLPLLAAKNDSIQMWMRVKDEIFKRVQLGARAVFYDAQGNIERAVNVRPGINTTINGSDVQIDTLAYLYVNLPRVDSTFVFDVVCDGFANLTLTYHLDKPKSKNSINSGDIFLKRAPRQLKEVTVVSSKIKFYHKGDTLVYNADTFELAEGSMLDALIAQLPGAELSSNGQITVNGRFVESLLLNGKDFFDNNRNLMLENIAAYTVKDIKVYEGIKPKDQLMNNKQADKAFIMDVRLKKEYSIGWIINAQAGYGTNDRYLGRLFVNRFSSTLRMSLVANANNLSDARPPGRDDTWTPETMPDGTRKVVTTAFDYNYSHPYGKSYAGGNVTFERLIDNVDRTTSRINFLPGGDTYENSFDRNRNSETYFDTYNYGGLIRKNFNYGLDLKARYIDAENSGSALSAAFDRAPSAINAEIIDALYSGSHQDLLETVINRSRTLADTRNRTWRVTADPSISTEIPWLPDGNVRISMETSYSSTRNYSWNDYTVNYGSDADAAVRSRLYSLRSPNHTFKINPQFYIRVDQGTPLSLTYTFKHSDEVKDASTYALDRLSDMGEYGVLPEGYVEAFDPGNSYASHTINNAHNLHFRTNIYHEYDNGNSLFGQLEPEVEFMHRSFGYLYKGHETRLTPHYTVVAVPFFRLGYGIGKKDRFSYRNSIEYNFRLTPTLPDLADMVDVVFDANPLNIYLGNPDLKTQYTQKHDLSWEYIPSAIALSNYFYLAYQKTYNALTRGFTYDTATGVRRNRMYNVDGNGFYQIYNSFKYQFGSRKQFTISSKTDVTFFSYGDMIGVNLEEPAPVKVRTRDATEKLRFTWQIGGQSITLRGDYTNRRTTSTEPGFNTLNAHHANFGISGVFKLPAGFGASTDFVCYTRRGYGSPQLDTTDPIWNLRITYAPPRSSRWVFMADGFDLLHSLSNVNYAVTAAGRTVSYTNALPRYFMLSVQYRLNIQPKK